MDRGRRAEPYSNATIWTREIARNLASHLSRVSNAHSCVDTRSPKSTRLPQFHAQKRCPTSPTKTRQPLTTINRNPNPKIGDQSLDVVGGEGDMREEIEGESSPNEEIEQHRSGEQELVHGSSKVVIPAVKPPAKKRTVNGSVSDMATYDSPQRHHVTHDYYKRQEQRKIWQENQALNKRLQSAKATLSFKEWEKEGKWTQEFLKTQERRRYALQQELRRVQISPQAVLRSRPLKSLHHHVKTFGLDSDKSLGLACSLSARDSVHRGSKGQPQLGNRCGIDATVQHSSAANHRRIMKLRKQKPSPLNSVVSRGSLSTDAVSVASADQTAFIPDNEIVTVRFTFSRGRSRSTTSDQPGLLVVEEGDRDMMSLSGAFSPGVELESELNAVAVNGTDPPESEAAAGSANDIAVEASEYYLSNADFHKNTVAVDSSTSRSSEPETGEASLEEQQRIEQVPDDTPAVVVESVRGDDSGTANHLKPPIESKQSSSPEVDRVQSGSHDEEEPYDGDNFDEDALLSGRATGGEFEKLEASGYASECEDEVHGNVTDAAPTENKGNSACTEPIYLDNQEEYSDDEEYSRDDFV